MSLHVFGQGVGNDVRSVVDRAQQCGSSHGIVHDQRNTVPVSDLGDGFDVQQVELRVGQCLEEDRFGIGADGFFEVGRVFRLDDGALHADPRQTDGQHGVRASVDARRGYDMVAGAHQTQQGREQRRRSRREGASSHTAVHFRQPAFQYVGSGVVQAGVDVARFGQVEDFSGIVCRGKMIGRSQVYRHSHCAGVLLGVESPLHGRSGQMWFFHRYFTIRMGTKVTIFVQPGKMFSLLLFSYKNVRKNEGNPHGRPERSV